MPTTDSLLAAALYYAGRPWPVFLLGRSKRPLANCPACKSAGAEHDPGTCTCLTCHAHHAATTDPQRITAMRTTHPRSLLAIRTGTASGLVVVDIDPRNGGALIPALMPPTATVATGGGGWHLYYRHPRGGLAIPSRGLPGYQGVDIKADGGYTVAPPSAHPLTKVPYTWAGNRPIVEMPPPLLNACLSMPAAFTPSGVKVSPHRPTAPAPRGSSATRGRGISSPTALLAAHLEAVARAPEGRRRTTLYGVARGVARMVAAGALLHTEALTALTDTGRAAGQTDRDIRAAITGGFRDEGVSA